jgi:hypothetical protein
MMGPGFSTLLALLCLVPAMLGDAPNPYLALFDSSSSASTSSTCCRWSRWMVA